MAVTQGLASRFLADLQSDAENVACVVVITLDGRITTFTSDRILTAPDRATLLRMLDTGVDDVSAFLEGH